MDGLTVARVDPARTAVEAAQFNRRPPRDGQRQRRRRTGRVSPLIATALPQVEPEMCEMLYATDEMGQITGVLVRDIATHETIATFDLAELTRLVAATGQRGVLFETQG